MRLDLWSRRRPAADTAARPDVRRRAVEVRWQGDAGPPRPFARPPGTLDDAASPKAVQMCPAVLDLEARLFELACPVDLELALGGSPDGATIRGGDGLPAVLRPAAAWRRHDRPVVEIAVPITFTAGEPVRLVVQPPFLRYRPEPLPGLVLDASLMLGTQAVRPVFAFEWHERDRPLRLAAGEPWLCLRFEAPGPGRPVRLAGTDGAALLAGGLDEAAA